MMTTMICWGLEPLQKIIAIIIVMFYSIFSAVVFELWYESVLAIPPSSSSPNLGPGPHFSPTLPLPRSSDVHGWGRSRGLSTSWTYISPLFSSASSTPPPPLESRFLIYHFFYPNTSLPPFGNSRNREETCLFQWRKLRLFLDVSGSKSSFSAKQNTLRCSPVVWNFSDRLLRFVLEPLDIF